jgi:HSP20 family protein
LTICHLFKKKHYICTGLEKPNKMKTEKNEFELLFPVDFLGKLTDRIFKESNIHSDWNKVFGYKETHPYANIIQKDNGVSLEMAIPGCDKKDIEISLEKNLLTISCKKEESKQTFARKEFSYHSFTRSFNLSDSLDKDSIKSSMNNGILTIEITKLNPETVKTQKKTIPVD